MRVMVRRFHADVPILVDSYHRAACLFIREPSVPCMKMNDRK